jgi:hypothetical protein
MGEKDNLGGRLPGSKFIQVLRCVGRSMSTLISGRAFARTLSLLPFASAALPAFAFEEPEGLSIGPRACASTARDARW